MSVLMDYKKTRFSHKNTINIKSVTQNCNMYDQFYVKYVFGV